MTSDSRALRDKDSELRAQLAALCYDTARNIKLYKPLAEWLGVYNYIPPDERKLMQVEVHIDDTALAYHIWEFLCMSECCLTLTEQYRSWTLINGY